MSNKRGQITIFLIFGFVILTAFLFLFYLNNQVKDIREKVETQMTLSDLTIPIKSYVDLCLRSTGEDALYLIGIQGGYFGMPSYKVDSKGVFYEAFHTVYLHNKKNVMPDIATIENEISEYVNENLDFCIKDFEDFKSQGYEIESSEFSTVASINRNNVAFSLDFQISLRKGGKSKLNATLFRFIDATVENSLLSISYPWLLKSSKSFMQKSKFSFTYSEISFSIVAISGITFFLLCR